MPSLYLADCIQDSDRPDTADSNAPVAVAAAAVPDAADASAPDEPVDGEKSELPERQKPEPQQAAQPDHDTEPNSRFDALVRDRDSLRAEVTDMRKSLEEIQSKHKADMEALQQKLDDTETKKEQAETQFQKLMERVNAIKSQLGERLKEDEVSPASSPAS